MTTPESATDPRLPTPDPIDVEALMAGIRARVAEKKARGLYSIDQIFVEPADVGEPWNLAQIQAAERSGVVINHLAVHQSTRPVVGRIIMGLKRMVVRAGAANQGAIVQQINEFHGNILSYASSLGTEITALRRDVDSLRQTLSGGPLDDLTARIDQIEASALDARLARLERGPGTSAPSVAAATATPLSAGIDGLRLATAVASAPDADLAAVLGTQQRALVLGCQDPATLDAIEAGTLTAVDADADVAGAAAADGRTVLAADPVGFVAALPDGSVDGVLVREQLERLRPDQAMALVAHLWRVVAPGGTVVISARNPRCPAEMRDFWRDPRRLRPQDPEALARLLEAAGFGGIETVHRELVQGEPLSTPSDEAARAIAVVGRR